MTNRFYLGLLPFAPLLGIGCNNTASSTSSDPDGGAHFVFLDAGPATPIPPDGASSCPVGECNYQTQQGCEAGQMCHPNPNAGSVSPACINAGTQSSGEACEWEQCAPGLFCAADGHCRHLCCGGDWSACETGESCTGVIQIQAADSDTPVPAGVSVCEPSDACNVFSSASCPTGKSCYVVDSRGSTKCLTSGAVPFNGACNATRLCLAGLTCVQNSQGSGSSCRRLCRAVPGGGEPNCPESEGGYCSHFVRDPPGVGECTPTL